MYPLTYKDSLLPVPPAYFPNDASEFAFALVSNACLAFSTFYFFPSQACKQEDCNALP